MGNISEEDLDCDIEDNILSAWNYGDLF